MFKIKKLYINKGGIKSAEKDLISKIKSLDKLYCTNNICESLHSKISNYLGNSKVSKSAFRDKVNHILNEYYYKISNNIRYDYVTRTIIIIVNKYNLNNKIKFIDFKLFNRELQNTIGLMTDNININVVNELISSIEKCDFYNSIVNNDVLNVDDIEGNKQEIDDIDSEENFENNSISLDNNDIDISSLIENMNNLDFHINESNNNNSLVELENEKIILDENEKNSSSNLLNINNNLDLLKIKKERGDLLLFNLEISNNINLDLKKLLLDYKINIINEKEEKNSNNSIELDCDSNNNNIYLIIKIIIKKREKKLKKVNLKIRNIINLKKILFFQINRNEFLFY